MRWQKSVLINSRLPLWSWNYLLYQAEVKVGHSSNRGWAFLIFTHLDVLTCSYLRRLYRTSLPQWRGQYAYSTASGAVQVLDDTLSHSSLQLQLEVLTVCSRPAQLHRQRLQQTVTDWPQWLYSIMQYRKTQLLCLIWSDMQEVTLCWLLPCGYYSYYAGLFHLLCRSYS